MSHFSLRIHSPLSLEAGPVRKSPIEFSSPSQLRTKDELATRMREIVQLEHEVADLVESATESLATIFSSASETNTPVAQLTRTASELNWDKYRSPTHTRCYTDPAPMPAPLSQPPPSQTPAHGSPREMIAKGLQEALGIADRMALMPMRQPPPPRVSGYTPSGPYRVGHGFER
ncbi:hypothetical protein J8273_5448 [Carpediemonas membranifera]|uniref:Uncharacterized protein n=1 Tax=Carpediemonas membranifera TaxID=201153 RepID=A0A8J6E0Z2_9EUKA|nr:hypothetical protein J8273_5448 [Carpediemonas membranifera]|eukprot:KAG9392456.1 hypothetical protein J8273_5448 [Carpediemonas membranifera]